MTRDNGFRDTPAKNFFELILDSLEGRRCTVALQSLVGEEIKVSGVHRGAFFEADDGTVYPYTAFKVSRFF